MNSVHTSHRSLFWLMSAVSMLATAPASSASGEITRIVAFGDSMTDTGNRFDISGGLLLAPPYWEGRASNGPVWIDYLADFLQVPRPVASRLGGTNGAVAGAPTGQGSFIETRNPPFGSLPSGIDIEIPRLGMQIDEMLASHTLSESDLVVVWAGFNDLNPNLPGGPLSPQQIVDNLTDHVTTLHEAGATHFLLANLHGGGERSTFNSLWQARVRELRQTLPSDPYFFSFESLVGDVFSRLGDFGFNGDTARIIDRTVDDPDQYTNWDGVHVTTAFHRVIAEAALETLQHLDGDYNDNGLVEQGDLDLVLLDWGQRGRPLPAGWLRYPPRGYIDQEELDRVLMNWGEKSFLLRQQASPVGIPEPASLVLGLAAAAALVICPFRSCG